MAEVIKRSPSGARAVEKTEVALAFGDIGAASVKTTSGAVAGLRATDDVVINRRAAFEAGVALGGAWVSAAGVLSAEATNPTAALVATASATYDVLIFRYAA